MATPSANPYNESATHPSGPAFHGEGSSQDENAHSSFYEGEEDVDLDSREASSDASDLLDNEEESADGVDEDEDAERGDREEEQRRREAELQRFQEELRRQIMEIQQDASVPQAEKSKRIQVCWRVEYEEAS